MGPQLFPLPTADTLKTDTVDPTVNDDINAGFSVGQHWINTTTDKGFECMDNAAGAAVWVETTAGASGGETNTASNVNVGGVGIFKQKAGVDLEFRGVNAASSKVSVALQALTNEIDVDVVEANLNIGNQSGTLTNDLAHGTRGGGSQHANVIAAGASGFMTGADKTKLDGLGAVYIVPCCVLGGKSDGLGKFLNANGATTMNDDSSKSRTRAPVAVPVGSTAKIVGCAYKTNLGTTNVVMKVHLNGSVVETFSLASINLNKGGQENWAGFAVVAGDYLELEYDADGGTGDKPGESIWWFLMEVTP